MPGSEPPPHPPPLPQPPTAPRRPHIWHRPTGDVHDPWAWMANTDDPAFHAYVAAENEFADRWLEAHATLIDSIDAEIRSRVQETDQAVPVEYDGWWYVTRTEEGRSYPIHHRGPAPDEATAEVVLDENAEAANRDFFDVGALDVSPDHRYLAWSADTTGGERYTLRIRDLSTGSDSAAHIGDVANAGVAWSRDGEWLFYVRPDDRERPCEVWRHRRGSDPNDDTLVHREDDERFYLSVALTRSREWIVIHTASTTTSEVHLLRSDDPMGQFGLVEPRRDDVDYLVDHWGDRFVMLTNEDAADFRVLATKGRQIDGAEWTEIVTHEPGRRITAAEPFEGHLVVHEWHDAQPRLRVVRRDGTHEMLDLGSDPHDVDLAPNPSWGTSAIRFRTTSLRHPNTEWEENLETRDRQLLRRTPTPNVDLDAYVAERMWVTGADGVEVPLDAVRHRDTPTDGTAPGVLYGYGAYEASIPPWFSVARLSLLDRGWIWALAHVRGGGELGRRWYLDGKLLAKPNSFGDLTACADHLIETRRVHADRLALRGASAGGLLVGSCATADPERYAAVIAEVPFVDVVTTMSDDSLPLTAIEREEWGDPRTEPFAGLMESYSPYDNTRPAAYPAMYVTGGLNDPRVGAHEPAKWVARLREVNSGDRPILLRVETGAGHGGPTGRYDAWRDEARVLAFLIANV